MLLGRLSSQAKNLSRNHRLLLVASNNNNNNFTNLNLVGVRSVSTFYERCKTKLFELMSVYEEIIGIKEVKQAQDSVQQAEKSFTHIQNQRRQLNQDLIDAQLKLRKIRDDMDRLSRTDSSYLKLFTEEHGLLKHESKLIADYKLKEEEERSAFFNLSSKLREAQERERIRVERTKYLQLVLSILGASLGILSTYLFNYKRNSNIREILEYDKEHFKTLEDSVKTIMEKQDGFESAMSKWNSSFQVSDVTPDSMLVVQSNQDDDEFFDDEQLASLNQIPLAKDYTNVYVNAAFLSLVLVASYILFLKTK